MSIDSAVTANSAETPKDHVRPLRQRKMEVFLWAVVYLVMGSVIAGGVSSILAFDEDRDLVQAAALAEYDIVLDDDQAGDVLSDGKYALVVDGTSEALITLGDGSDVGAGRIELHLYVPVEGVHGHDH